MAQKDDYAPNGVRIEGAWENDRNAAYSDLYKAIIREAFGVRDVIIAHHLVFVSEAMGQDGSNYTTVEEIPSADTLIFDHVVAKKIWGPAWRGVLHLLAMEPVETRDALLNKMFHARNGGSSPLPGVRYCDDGGCGVLPQ